MGHTIASIRKAIRTRFIKRWGSAAARRLLWDEEFASGQWNYLERTPDDPVYSYLERYGENGNILDLGCGSGNTGNELDYSKYASYTGTDVSAVAIHKAETRSKQNQREAKNKYECADIETYAPSGSYDLILFRESIFYIPLSKIRRVLDRYSEYLTDHGVFIIRMCDKNKYDAIVNLIARHYRVIDQYTVNEAKDIVIVFAPSGRLSSIIVS